MPGGIVLLIVAIVVITAIVGAIARFLNKLNEANAPAPRNVRGDVPRQTQKDMDRFLAEIDRLRKKNAGEPEPTAAKPVPEAKPAKARPVSNKPSRPDRAKPARPMAEVVEPPKRKRVDTSPMETSPPKSNPASLPVATVVGGMAPKAGAPMAARMSKLAALPGSKPNSRLDTSLATLLASRNGLALAVVLQEVLGPPKCKKT